MELTSGMVRTSVSRRTFLFLVEDGERSPSFCKFI